VKTGCNLAESSKEGYGSKRAVLPMMMIHPNMIFYDQKYNADYSIVDFYFNLTEFHDGFSCFVISVLNQKTWASQSVAHKPYNQLQLILVKVLHFILLQF
jgi:hypothetical protein